MIGNSTRLVGRIQRRLQAAEPVGGSTRLSRQDRAELEARVRALRAKGDCFHHVGLSRQVAPDGVIAVSSGVGGECVATEV